jgi:predicted RNase H-like HicB family nuclease
MKLTAIIEKGENGWYVGQLEEIPAVISQGRTIEELKANLLNALQLVLETQRELTQKEYEGGDFIKEDFLQIHI